MFVYGWIKSGASLPEILMCLLAVVLAGWLSISVHEVAHGFVAYKCGDPTAKQMNRLTLNPVAHFDLTGVVMLFLVGFGWAKPVPINPNNFNHYKRDMISVSLAGVIANFAMCGLGLLLLYFLYPFLIVSVSSVAFIFQILAYYFLLFFIQINFMLAFFNLLPIYPLDGFRFLNVCLKPGNKFSSFMQKYGGWCLLTLVVLGNVFRAVGLEYLDIFYWANYPIGRLIDLVTAV